MLLVFLLVIFSTMMGKIRGGNFIYLVSRYWADIWYFLIGVRTRRIHLVPLDKTKRYIYVANHISYLDIPNIVQSIRHQPIRALGKLETSKIPIFGYIYRSGAVTVDRQDAYQRARSVLILKSILKKGISIFIFPEGTFNETDKPLKSFFDGAFRIAIETQTPIKPICFLDTYQRLNFKSIFSLTPGKNRIIFLEEVQTSGLTMNDLPDLKNCVFEQMEAVLKQNNCCWIKH
jgi:1-acyl-sn-glycerol-3-phosphate acyltransferase